MSRYLVLASILVGCLASGCAPSADPAAEQAAIRAIDSQMVAALNARDLDTWIGFLAEDARMMPPSAPPVEGKAAIRELAAGLLSLPDFSVTHHPPDRIVVSQSGDLAYISYAYELTVPGSEGASITEKGKDISIFQKQPDGSWKLVVDIWSPNQTP
jgi:ketosteroid isomerase-like protein